MRSLAVVASLLLTASSVSAEPASNGGERTGFYLGLATGAGFAWSNATTQGTDLVERPTSPHGAEISTGLSGSAMAGHLLAGWAPWAGLALGGGHVGNILPSATRSGTSVGSLATYTFGVTGPFIDWYFDPHKGLHMFAMPGLCDIVEGAPGGATHGLFGAAGALGLGYDVWITEHWTLGAMGRGLFGFASWSGPQAGASSPVNVDLTGMALRETQTAAGAALVITATYW